MCSSNPAVTYLEKTKSVCQAPTCPSSLQAVMSAKWGLTRGNVAHTQMHSPLP